MKLFMVIENFHEGKLNEIYDCLKREGRKLPEGLSYIDSWVDEDLTRCFQLMQCDNEQLLEEWAAKWSHWMDFEFIPVLHSTKLQFSS